MTTGTNLPNPTTDDSGTAWDGGVLRTLCGHLGRGLVWLVQLVGFVALVADEWVTARLGVPAVVPRLRRWRQRLSTEFRAYRAVLDGSVVEGEFIEGESEGVWR